MATQRRLSVSRPVPPESMSISQLSTLELKAELARRIAKLHKLRQEYAEGLDQVDHELHALGVEADPKSSRTRRKPASRKKPAGRKTGARRRRRTDQVPLVEVLAKCLNGIPMRTADLANAARDAGYKTTAENFAATVNTALYRDDRFERRTERSHN